VEKEESSGKRGESAPLGGEGGAARRGNRAGYCRKNGAAYTRRYPFEIRLKAVKLYLEEQMPSALVAQEVGVPAGTIFYWIQNYRKHGEAGLRDTTNYYRRSNGPDALTEKITALKKNNPHFGGKRISQILRRIFLLKASPETVRKRLKKAGLGTPAKKARKPPKPKIQFFERTAPNETWQSDITTVRILGQNAYIIGFIDDYSRYIVGHGLFRSQTADRVMELYRNAAATYGIPKEMLTDNGRQYASWRGTSKFGKELRRDKVHHIRSQPHHPQTLGKIERFWKSLKEEYLDRARFDTFEEAQERLTFWVKYYNYKRPHQGIGGVCPADRYFSVQKELRQVIERGVEENVEELALRGVPAKPFYMVGQMGDQSVVLRTEKGKLKMMVGGAEGKEVVYDIGKGSDEGGRDGDEDKAGLEDVQRQREMPGGVVGMVGPAIAGLAVQGDGDELGRVVRMGEDGVGGDPAGVGPGMEAGQQRRDTTGKADRGVAGEGGSGGGGADRAELKGGGHDDRKIDVEGGREVPCGTGAMDGTPEGCGDSEGTGSELESVEAMAGAGDGRHARLPGAAVAQSGFDGSGVGEHGEETAGAKIETAGDWQPVTTGPEVDKAAGDEGPGAGLVRKGVNEDFGRVQSQGPGDRHGGHPGPGEVDDGDGSGGAPGDEPEDLLQVGETDPAGDDGSGGRKGFRAAGDRSGCGEGATPAADRGVEEGTALAGTEASYS